MALFIYARLFFKRENHTLLSSNKQTYKKHYNIGKIFAESVSNSMDTLINVLGYIMFFSLVINLMDTTPVSYTHLILIWIKTTLHLVNGASIIIFANLIHALKIITIINLAIYPIKK